jgi:polyhydroxybutyrate depolymerase
MIRLCNYVVVLVLAIDMLTGCVGPPPEIPPGPKEVQLGHDNYIRNVTYHIPKRLRRRRRGLVLLLHDADETPESTMRMTKRGFNKLSDRHNFIVGYPEALNLHWNDARTDSISLSHYNEIDDVGFIDQVVQYAIDSFRIDPERIFVSGFSEGGLMVFRLACERPHVFKGFASVAASLSLDQLVECTPDTTISLMMINGTRDPILPYDGGQMEIDETEAGSMLAPEEAINFWLEENQCTEKSSEKDMANRDTFDETRSIRTTYNDCEQKNEIVLIRVVNGGHAWPGGRQYQNERSIGKVSDDFDASEEIWKFFRSL